MKAMRGSTLQLWLYRMFVQQKAPKGVVGAAAPRGAVPRTLEEQPSPSVRELGTTGWHLRQPLWGLAYNTS